MSHELKKVKLSSGKTLNFSLAPFAEAKELYQAISKELKSVSLKDGLTVESGKDFALTLLSSEEIDSIAMKCASYCLYEKDRINEETFEPEDARADYLDIMYHVIIENTKPFTKSLWQKYGGLAERAKEVLLKDHA